MRTLLLVFLLLCFHVVGYADVDLYSSYDYYLQSSRSNNFGDAEGFTVGLKHSIVGNLNGVLDFSKIYDIDFPVIDDPNGQFGTMSGTGVMYGLQYMVPVTKQIDLYASGKVGGYWWDFEEGVFLRNNNVTVDVSPSFASRCGVGTNVALTKDLSFNFEWGWFASSPKKEASDGTQEWNILDDDTLGLQWQYFSTGMTWRF